MNEKKNIELKSEKVRSIIGTVPSILSRIGISIITGIIILFLTLMYVIPYPQNETMGVNIYHIDGEYYAKGKIMVEDAKSLCVGQCVDILIISLDKDYSIKGYIYKIKEFEGIALVEIKIKPIPTDVVHLNTLPMGKATIHISNMPILKRLLNYK